MARINRGAVRAIVASRLAQREREDQIQKDRQEFSQRLVEAGLKAEIESGRLGYNVGTGQFETRTPQTIDPASLRPWETLSQRLPGGVTRTYRSPQANSLTDLQRELSVENTLQSIEQRNRLAPLLAEEQRIKAGTPKKFLGIQYGTSYPPSVTVPTVDTSSYRTRLNQLRSRGLTQGPSASAVSQNEVSELLTGVQQGLIRSQQDAVAVIEEAGLDPNDPAFAEILNQLP